MVTQRTYTPRHCRVTARHGRLVEAWFRWLAQLQAMEARGPLAEQVWKRRGTTDVKQVMAGVRQRLKSLANHHIHCGPHLCDGDTFRPHNMESGDWQALDHGPLPPFFTGLSHRLSTDPRTGSCCGFDQATARDAVSRSRWRNPPFIRFPVTF